MALICSFCGNTESPKVKIIEGLKANICSKCLKICAEDFDEMDISDLKSLDGILNLKN